MSEQVALAVQLLIGDTWQRTERSVKCSTREVSDATRSIIHYERLSARLLWHAGRHDQQ